MKAYFSLIATSVVLGFGGIHPLSGQTVTVDGANVGAGGGGGGGSQSVSAVTVQRADPAEPTEPENPAPPSRSKDTAQVRTDTQTVQLAEAADQLERAHSQLELLNDQFFRGGGNSGRTLIVGSAGADLKEQGELEEDLAVMSHILDKAAAGEPGPGGRNAAGINILFVPGGSPLRNLYLDGYGALFMLNVNFALVASPTEAGTKEVQPTNSAWEEARHELYGPGDGGGKIGPWGPDHSGGPAEAFSEERVAQFKASLLDALKNASNIRGLKADDWIAICVVGTSASKDFRAHGKGSVSVGGGYGYGGSLDPFSGSAGTNWKAFGTMPVQHTIMTLRVKKADVDAFAKGDLDSGKFQKKVNVATYFSGTGSE